MLLLDSSCDIPDLGILMVSIVLCLIFECIAIFFVGLCNMIVVVNQDEWGTLHLSLQQHSIFIISYLCLYSNFWWLYQ